MPYSTSSSGNKKSTGEIPEINVGFETYTEDNFTGTQVTIPGLSTRTEDIQIFLSGVGELAEGAGRDWTRSGNTITLTFPVVGSGYRLLVRYLKTL